jgi:hypothetical protein
MIMQKLHRDYQKDGLLANLGGEEENLGTFFCWVCLLPWPWWSWGRDGLPLILNTAPGKAEK